MAMMAWSTHVTASLANHAPFNPISLAAVLIAENV